MSGKYRLTREEKETVIRCSAADSKWDICTADPRVVRYLKRQGYEPTTDYQLSDYVSCKVPFDRLRIRKREIKTSAERMAGLAFGTKLNEVKPRLALGKKGKGTITPTPISVEG